MGAVFAAGVITVAVGVAYLGLWLRGPGRLRRVVAQHLADPGWAAGDRDIHNAVDQELRSLNEMDRARPVTSRMSAIVAVYAGAVCTVLAVVTAFANTGGGRWALPVTSVAVGGGFVLWGLVSTARLRPQIDDQRDGAAR